MYMIRTQQKLLRNCHLTNYHLYCFKQIPTQLHLYILKRHLLFFLNYQMKSLNEKKENGLCRRSSLPYLLDQISENWATEKNRR
jgi:hypothetical protein